MASPCARLALAACLLQAAWASPRRRHWGCTPGNHSFDYFLLVQGWPNSACQAHPCGESTFGQLSVWTMHGLWPSRAGDAASSYPCKCDSRSFDESQVQSIEDQLHQYWPSYEGNAAEFWTHEWEKHGTCSSDTKDLATELGYFSKTLALRGAHDIGAALKKASITPENSKEYTAQELFAALTPVNGFKPLLGCVRAHGKQYLHEVSFCLDKSLNDMQCDDGVLHVHGDEVSNCDLAQTMVLVEPATARDYVSV